MSQETAVYLHRPGDASSLQAVAMELPPPGPGEVRVRHTAIGVNFVDVYHRIGLYPLPPLPVVLGVEAAGLVEALGDGIEGLAIGDRVAYAGPPVGAYASARNVDASRLLPIPPQVADTQVAGALLRGITAHMLFEYVRPIEPGDTVLVQSAAGGLGQILGQWGSSLGARMIGTVGNAAKGEIALRCGYTNAIPYKALDFVAETLNLTEGRGVDFAIDGVGGETLLKTLQTVRPFGLAASIGQAGVPGNEDRAQLPLSALGPSRSIALARPGVFRFMSDPARYREGASATLERLAKGLSVDVAAELPLQQAGEAHRLLEAGQSAGAILLHP